MISPFVVLVLCAIFVVVLGSETSSCKENERLLECTPCGPTKCSHLGTPIPCAGNTARCVQQCACIDGFVWNDDGKCVLKKDCPSCGGDPNAVSGCGNHCGNTCADYRDKEKVCMSGCRYNACDCREGYVYDEQQEKCVRPVDCAIKTCGKNEEWALSNNACQPDTCEFLFLLNPECGNETTVEPGCRCIEGFSRVNESSNCIPSEECPKPGPVCKDNEFYSNCTNGCEITCSSRYRSDGRVCPGSCQESCVCEDGYLRHDNGSCVPVEMCSPPTCNADEVYLECGPACEDTCQSTRNICHDCIVNCTAGCFCANNTVRMLGNNSMCVPKDSCPPQSCGSNQYFDDCPDPSSEQSCASLNSTQKWTMEIKGCCKPQCRCSKDFYRHDNGTCVAANDCTEE